MHAVRHFNSCDTLLLPEGTFFTLLLMAACWFSVLCRREHPAAHRWARVPLSVRAWGWSYRGTGFVRAPPFRITAVVRLRTAGTNEEDPSLPRVLVSS